MFRRPRDALIQNCNFLAVLLEAEPARELLALTIARPAALRQQFLKKMRKRGSLEVPKQYGWTG